jgi:hypothetical protein
MEQLENRQQATGNRQQAIADTMNHDNSRTTGNDIYLLLQVPSSLCRDAHHDPHTSIFGIYSIFVKLFPFGDWIPIYNLHYDLGTSFIIQL